MNLRIDLNEPSIIEKVTSDEFGMLVALECKRVYDPYTPRDTGLTMQTAIIRAWEIVYIQPYSAYQYFGVLYVDPVYNKGGFYSSDYGYWSRPGVKKVPSGRMLTYQKVNPYSTDHWDEKALEAGKFENVYMAINDALRSGRF